MHTVPALWPGSSRGGCRVSPLLLLSPPFKLEITLNLGTVLQRWAGCSSEFLHLITCENWNFRAVWGWFQIFTAVHETPYRGAVAAALFNQIFALVTINQVYFFCIWLHVLRQGSLCNGVDFSSVHCRGLHINFLL